MPTEITVLALAGLLQAAQFALLSVKANIEIGSGRLMSPRDPQRLDSPLESRMSVGTGRLHRAFNNHFEGLILFTLAVVVVTLGDAASSFTAGCAWVYLVARMLYVPAYWLGLSPWRSLVWFAGFLATVAMIAAALLG